MIQGMNTVTKRIIFSAIILFLLLAPIASNAGNADPYKYSLCDIRVLYVYENSEQIDWASIFYLNDKYGCRVDLLNIKLGSKLDRTASGIPDKEIYLNVITVNADDSSWTKKLAKDLFTSRKPDIVIFGSAANNQTKEFKKYILELKKTPREYFGIRKVYEFSNNPKSELESNRRSITLSHRELLNRYHDRIEYEVPNLFPFYKIDEFGNNNQGRYILLKNNIRSAFDEVDFLSGLERIRLIDAINTIFQAGPKKSTLHKQATRFISFFNLSRNSINPKKTELLIDGYRELDNLVHEQNFGAEAEAIVDFIPYLNELFNRVENVVLNVIGINWEGKIFLRDSPHGPKAKIRVILSVDSPLDVKLRRLVFHPYWDTTRVMLSDEPIKISPHQSFEREYLVDIDRQYLEANQPESLLFSADIIYRKNIMTFRNSLPVWEAPHLSVSFIPDFQFIPPFKQLEIDRVVTSMRVRVNITKPKNFADTVKLHLETPHGMFAGSYKSVHYLEKGVTQKSLSIPFTISNLFELGIQHQYVKLIVDNREIAVDTGLIRIASCKIADNVKVGFLPDTTGLLEDILRMTDAAYQPLTEQTLLTYDLNAYNVIVLGSGSFRKYPSILRIKGRLENYIRQGGSLVIFGQPDDWSEGVLPVGFVPAEEYVSKDEIVNRIPEARVLSGKYPVSDKNLFSSFYKKKKVNSAVISPAEVVYKTPSGGALLSISRIGDGQIIYCGLPLLEMITRLDIDAIHLFANLLNY